MKRIARKQKDRFKGWLDQLLDEHGAKVLVILLGLLVVVPAGITWRYLTTTADVADQAKSASHRAARVSYRIAELQIDTVEALVESCQHNGNSVRKILREEQRAALTSPDDPRLHALLPSTPQSVIARIVRQGNKEHRERIRRLHPVPCRAQYPLP